MTVQEFFDKYNNKGIDFDHAFGTQCVDLYDQYCQDVLGAPIILVEGAVNIWNSYPTDYLTKIVNTPSAIPKKGDIIIWNVGRYGHVAVFSSGDVNSFISFDQNWPIQMDANGNGLGVAHFQPHSYTNVLGWLHPKKDVNTPSPQPVPSQPSEDESRAILVLKNHISGSTDQNNKPFGNLEGYANTLTQDAYNAWKKPPTLANFSTSELFKELMHRFGLG